MLIRSPADLGAIIRERRKQLKLDQAELAKRIGVSRQWLVGVEQGHPRAALGLVLRAIDTLMDELVALLGGREIGRVYSKKDGKFTFVYDQEWRLAEKAYPLSLSMPLAAEKHGSDVVQAFLWGLLPDNEQVLDRWARRFQVEVGIRQWSKLANEVRMDGEEVRTRLISMAEQLPDEVSAICTRANKDGLDNPTVDRLAMELIAGAKECLKVLANL